MIQIDIFFHAGHSFTQYGNKVYLFGGLANYGNDPKTSIPRFVIKSCTANEDNFVGMRQYI